MLSLILILLAIVCFGARFFVADGRITAAGGILLAVAVALGERGDVLIK